MKFHRNGLMIGVLFVLLMSGGCRTQDKDSAYPEGCGSEGIEFSGKKVIVNNGTGGALNLFLFHNVSGGAVLLNRGPEKDPGASAGWASELSSGNWSALAINIRDFTLTCAKTGSGNYEELTCKDVLEACAYSKAVFKAGDSGSYWVEEDKPLNAVLDGIKSRGIGLKN